MTKNEAADEQTQSRLTFAVGRVAATAVVTLHGELDEEGGEQLAPVLRRVIDDERNEVVVLDLSDLASVEEGATNVFRKASDWARRQGVRVRVHRPPAALTGQLEEPRLGLEMDIV